MSKIHRVALGRGRVAEVEIIGDQVELRLPGGVRLRLSRRAALDLAQVLDAVARAA